ncbi:AAA family ATPase [Acinetobacter sp.]|uniref:AAA family ATPase n=1 Tax=Acinetobacter sp. TaxID=472 RepID=UPI00388D3E86
MNQVWCEKFRPKTVAEVILSNAHERKTFDKYVEEQEIPNLLLQGGPGTGKSSLSLALSRDLQLDRSDVLKINCSDEKIEAMRDKVKNFAMTMSVGKFKLVRLEELDGIGPDAQRLLRDLIETTERNCRFIATCNYMHLIIPPLRSRFQEFVLKAPAKDLVLVRAAEILEAEKIDFDLDDLEKVVAVGYPDFRKIIQLMEQSSKTGKLIIKGAESAQDWKLQLLPLIEASDINGARALVCETATKEELIDIYKFVYDNLHRMKKLKRQDEAVITIAEYMYRHSFCSDPELNVAAMFIEIAALI